VFLVALSGCSSAPSRIISPDVDAAEAAAAAVKKYDRDSDGRLNESELSACPSLAHALAGYDADADKALTAAEIEAGVARWTEQKTGAITLPFYVTMDGRPLAGANIRIVPEDFLQGAVKPASATSNNAGSGFLGMSKEDRPANAPNLPLVQPGLYRVEITHPAVSLPAKYNTETTLGLETSIAGQNPSGVTWSLTSK
jgi:hypothetical protein